MSGSVARAAGLTLDEGPIERTAIDTLRALAAGGAGATLATATHVAMAPLVYVLWQRFVRFDPDDPAWPNRDRFLLCADEGAARLLEALRHLAGVKAYGAHGERELAVTLEDLERPRARTALGACDETRPLPDAESLLRGSASARLEASAVLAASAREHALRFDRPGFAFFDYDVYALCTDGCFGREVTSEAAARAAQQRLSNLCWIYHDAAAFQEQQSPARGTNLARRLRACGWNVICVQDACDTRALSDAFGVFRATSDRPTLLVAGGESGATPGAAVRELVPPGVREHFRDVSGRRGRMLRSAWFVRLEAYRSRHPELAREIDDMQHAALPESP